MAQEQEALFDKGLQRTFAYTPTGNVATGKIISFGAGLDRFVAVANAAIPANTGGTLEFAGVYKVKKKASTTFEIGEQVGWDEGASQAVNHDDGDLDFNLGVCVGPAAATDDFVLTVINQARGWEGSGSGL